jgi:hypothetical protein
VELATPAAANRQQLRVRTVLTNLYRLAQQHDDPYTPIRNGRSKQ